MNAPRQLDPLRVYGGRSHHPGKKQRGSLGHRGRRFNRGATNVRRLDCDPRAALPGPSKTITVEPVKLPHTSPRELPAPQRPAKREPAREPARQS